MTLNNKLSEIEQLINNGILKISQIEWWLLKYGNDYRRTYDYVYSQHLFKMDDGSIARLPPCGEPTDEENFLKLYEALDTISNFHRNEKYFEQEMVFYQKIKHSHSDLKNWILKNEKLGAEKYVCFLIDYLDYEENEQEEHLKVYINISKDFDIYIDREDFKNTIDFLFTFQEIYYVDKIHMQ